MSNEKMAVCKDLRADVCINYKIEDFLKMVKEETGGFFFFLILKPQFSSMFIEIDVFHYSFCNDY